MEGFWYGSFMCPICLDVMSVRITEKERKLVHLPRPSYVSKCPNDGKEFEVPTVELKEIPKEPTNA